MFSFTPATTGQSRLFLTSSSIRETFVELATSTTAPLCLLDVEEPYAIVVTAQDRHVSVEVPGSQTLTRTRRPCRDPAPTAPTALPLFKIDTKLLRAPDRLFCRSRRKAGPKPRQPSGDGGRIGRTLCSTESDPVAARDQGGVDVAYDMHLSDVNVNVAQLPPCEKCRRAAEKLTEEEQKP